MLAIENASGEVARQGREPRVSARAERAPRIPFNRPPDPNPRAKVRSGTTGRLLRLCLITKPALGARRSSLPLANMLARYPLPQHFSSQVRRVHLPFHIFRSDDSRSICGAMVPSGKRRVLS